MAQLGFYGAAGTVTGSCFLVTTQDSCVLVDCGLFQGPREISERNHQPFPFSPADVDHVVLTHSHMDHSGLLPRLIKEGYRGKIIATRPSVDLARIMLPDSGHIHEMEAEWKNRKRTRAGLPPEPPLYTIADAEASLDHLLSVNYDEVVSLSPSVKIRLRDAGHILGSAIVEMWITEHTGPIKLVFSGDVGNGGQPIVCDPTLIESADYLVLESTYGDRLHELSDQRRPQLARVINETVQRRGNVVIPAFAIERTQDLLYELGVLFHEGTIPPGIATYVDSPLATKATEIFVKHPGYYDYETLQLLKQGYKPLSFNNLQFVRSVEESKRLNTEANSSIIISASGMCDAGRIKHHLKHNLWRPESSVLFVGYQAEGTLGRRLLEGAKSVQIFGERIAVRAKIHSLGAYSAHADQKGLVDWVRSINAAPKRVFLVHGEQRALHGLAHALETELGIEAQIPAQGQTVNIPIDASMGQDSKPLSTYKPGVTLRDVQLEIDELLRAIPSGMEQDLSPQIEEISKYVAELRGRIEAAAANE